MNNNSLLAGGGSIKLGSLFDGIGAFPYAASFFGIEPVWASEILPNAVSITKRHFPNMQHLGDITKLDGGKIPPVSVLCAGSPCQSFSTAAARRTGFAGKSGLFWEAIRIIREMRCASDGKWPEICVFENVPGILNCNAGRDYQAVIAAFCETEIPMPESGKWANAGMVRGGRVDFAWVVKDAQHYRVPQRRKRLFAVADFTGQRAAEILFESKSLSGYFAAREFARERTAVYAESGAGSADCGGVAATEALCAFMAGQSKSARSIAFSETLSPTLKCSPSGLNQTPCIVEPQITRTLTARHDSSSCVDRGQNVVALAQTEQYTANCLTPWDSQSTRVFTPDSFAPTLVGADQTGGRNPAGLIMTAVHPEISGTLCGSGAGTSRTAGNCNETDLAVAYCLQGSGTIDRQEHSGPQGKGVNAEITYTLNTNDQHAVAAPDCRNLALNDQNPVRTGYVVRRLTPTECERLMAFPDGYTAVGHDGKQMSDSARYAMLGNSIVVNVLAYIMQNAAQRLGRGNNS